MKSSQLLGFLLIGACIVITGYALKGSVRPSLSVKEVLASPGEPCKLYGKVVKGSGHYNMNAARLDFRLQDAKGDVVAVVYEKPKPANFDQADSVGAKGAYRDGVFQADELVLKCPSKYIGKPPVPTKGGAGKDPYAALGKGT